MIFVRMESTSTGRGWHRSRSSGFPDRHHPCRGAEGDGVELELRSAIEPWHVLGDDSSSGAAARYVDSSTERLQVSVRNFEPARHLWRATGRRCRWLRPAHPAITSRESAQGMEAWSSLHPTLDLDTPLRFDLIDRASQLSLGGATYHVVHPGGRSYDTPPVNAKEAEARRARRFEAGGHAAGVIDAGARVTACLARGCGADYALTWICADGCLAVGASSAAPEASEWSHDDGSRALPRRRQSAGHVLHSQRLRRVRRARRDRTPGLVDARRRARRVRGD